MSGSLNVAQLQYLFTTTLRVYRHWTWMKGFPVLVDEIGTVDARLLWIGPRNGKRVILYFHGGAYSLPVQPFGLSFWNHIRLKLESEGLPIGVAVLNFTLIPNERFPTQLIQAVEALKHLIANGYEPQDIFIAGDSAGANLILALSSHILHPILLENAGVTAVPSLSLTSPIGGAYLMSPWTSLTPGARGSSVENDAHDIMTSRTLRYYERKVLEGVPESLRVYLEVNKAPVGWFAGIDKLVKRVLITAGELEILRDDIESVAREISRYHNDVEVIVQENGVHVDPFYDIRGDLTEKILDWFRGGLRTEYVGTVFAPPQIHLFYF
ncbi:hypothetical protein H0H93_004275 [Arthromyces matolae]|nr:hypothetical protein H0H93_004275 [Arthromyces matolae]